MRRAIWVAPVLLLAALLGAAACVGGGGPLPSGAPSDQNEPPDDDDDAPPTPKPIATPTTPGTTPKPDDRPPVLPGRTLGAASGVTKIEFVETSFGGIGCVRTETFDVDLGAKTMVVGTCANTDAGLSKKTVTIADPDIVSIRGLIDALTEDASKADAGCSGFDGTSRKLGLTYGSAPTVTVGFEYNCSGPRPDVRVDRPSFVGFRAKLYLLAGLDPAMRPF